MFRFRIEYSKKRPAAYISHLDLNRLFTRAIRRAGLPVALTKGYHPHYKLSFGSVLPVGMEGEREYLDIVLTHQLTSEEIIKNLNQQMPPGLKVEGVREVFSEAPSLMSMINTASYALIGRIYPGIIKSAVEFKQRLEELWEIESWIVTRSTKKGRREVDVRAGVVSLDLNWDDNLVKGDICLKLNSSKAVRPHEVLDVLEIYGNIKWKKENSKIWRTGLFITEDHTIRSPMEIDEIFKER